MVDYEKLLRKVPPPKRKIPFLKYTLIGASLIVGLFLLGAIGWAVYFNTQLIVYQDDLYKFSIKYPKTWKVIVHPKKTVAVIFIRPKDTAMDTMRENFNVTVQPMPEDIFTLSEFSGRIKGQAIAVFGRNIAEYRPLHWGWHQGYKMTIVAPHPDNLIMVNAWVLNRGQSYILTFLGLIDKYPQDRLIVKEMIRSLRLQ